MAKSEPPAKGLILLYQAWVTGDGSANGGDIILRNIEEALKRALGAKGFTSYSASCSRADDGSILCSIGEMFVEAKDADVREVFITCRRTLKDGTFEVKAKIND